MEGLFGSALFSAICGLLTASWLGIQVMAWRSFRRLRWSRDYHPPPRTEWPSLSVIIPARDEESTLAEALKTVLAQNYEPLEIVLVNDRSTDGTGRIMHAAAASDSRVRVLDIQEIPDRWLGKVHALHRGTEEATGDLLLYTDADVHFREGFLRKAVSWLLENSLDHLAVGPEVKTAGFWLETACDAFMGMFLLGMQAQKIGLPGSDAYIGIGAFNLVRRNALARTPGFPWLRMEVLDDVGLGLMLKQAGGRAGLLLGVGELSLTWYGSLRAMADGLEKNMFGAICRFRYRRLPVFVLSALLLAFSPPAALIQPWAPWLRWLGAAVFLLQWGLSEYACRHAGRGRLAGFLAPLGSLLVAWMVVRSAWKCFRRGGVRWRDTVYPLEQLREGQRVKL